MAEEKINFEKEMKRLNEIVNAIQEEGVSLDESIKLYEEGTKIIATLEQELKLAEEKVEKVVAINKK